MAALEGARVGHAAALAFCAGPPLGSIQRRMPLNWCPHMVSDRRWRRVDRVDARNIRVGQPVQFQTIAGATVGIMKIAFPDLHCRKTARAVGRAKIPNVSPL